MLKNSYARKKQVHMYMYRQTCKCARAMKRTCNLDAYDAPMRRT